LHFVLSWRHDLLNVLQVRSIVIAGLLFVSLAVLNAALLLPASATVAEQPAPCHHTTTTPLPGGHHDLNHRCCTLGHHRARTSASVEISTPLLRSCAGVILYAVPIASDEHRLPEFNDSGPPHVTPLRI